MACKRSSTATTAPGSIKLTGAVDLEFYNWVKLRDFSVTQNDLTPAILERLTMAELETNDLLNITLAALWGANARARGFIMPEGDVEDFHGEFRYKLILRRIQDYTDVQLPGLPLFEIVGPEKLGHYFRKLQIKSGGGHLVMFPGGRK